MKFKISHILDNIATWGIMLGILLSGIGAAIGICLLVSMPHNDWCQVMGVMLCGQAMTIKAFIKTACVFNILLFAIFAASLALGYISVFLLGSAIKEES